MDGPVFEKRPFRAILVDIERIPGGLAGKSWAKSSDW